MVPVFVRCSLAFACMPLAQHLTFLYHIICRPPDRLSWPAHELLSIPNSGLSAGESVARLGYFKAYKAPEHLAASTYRTKCSAVPDSRLSVCVEVGAGRCEVHFHVHSFRHGLPSAVGRSFPRVARESGHHLGTESRDRINLKGR